MKDPRHAVLDEGGHRLLAAQPCGRGWRDVPFPPLILSSPGLLRCVALRSQQLRQLPPSLWSLPALTSLDLSRNYLTCRGLPGSAASWGELPALKSLVLAHNSLKGVPSGLDALKNLTVLNLRSNKLRGGAAAALASLGTHMTQLQTLDVRFNPKLGVVPPRVGRLDLVGEYDSDEEVAENPKEEGTLAAVSAARAVAPTAAAVAVSGRSWPSLREQLEPLSTPEIRERLRDVFGQSVADRGHAGFGREALLDRLEEQYAIRRRRRLDRGARKLPVGFALGLWVAAVLLWCRGRVRHVGIKGSLPWLAAAAAVVYWRRRQQWRQRLPSQSCDDGMAARPVRVACGGACLPDALAARLLRALRSTEWPSKSDRPSVTSTGYIVLELPPPSGGGGGAAKRLNARQRAAAAKRERHRELCSAAVAVADFAIPAARRRRINSVTFAKGFRGSPHIDRRDLAPQWLLSLGGFAPTDAERLGGRLCVEVSPLLVVAIDIRQRLTCVDGRYTHFVAPGYEGERFSMQLFSTRGEWEPRVPWGSDGSNSTS